jgi:rRNA maturation endonuclease Nob1
MSQQFNSTITYKNYCEACRAEYSTETPEKGCPACEAKKQSDKKQKTKGGGKND